MAQRNGTYFALPSPLAATRTQKVEDRTDFILTDPDMRPVGEKVMTLLANGVSPPKIQKLTGVDAEVVRCIRDRNPRLLRNLKEALARNLAEASQIMSEELIASAHKMPPEYLAKSLAQTIDKFQLLSGGVTARTEVRQISSPEELQKLFDSLPEANAKLVKENANPVLPRD